MGRLGLFQRSKHAGQQLHARVLSLVFLPTSRFDAEIDWRGRRLSELTRGLRITYQRSLHFVSAQRLDAEEEKGAPLPLFSLLKDKPQPSLGAMTQTTGLTIFLAYMAVQWARICYAFIHVNV